MDGYGVIYDKDGNKRYKGEFKDGKFDGVGKLFNYS